MTIPLPLARALFALLPILAMASTHAATPTPAGCQASGCPSGSSCQAAKSACEGPGGSHSACMALQCVAARPPSLDLSARMTCAPWDGAAYMFVILDPQGSYGSLFAHVYDSFPSEGQTRAYRLGAKPGRASVLPSSEPGLPTGSEPKGASGTLLTLSRKGGLLDGSLRISGRDIPIHTPIDPAPASCGGALPQSH